jgi:phosphoglycerate dehydrogenase-like enzyme
MGSRINSRHSAPSVLILYDRPEEFLPHLCARFPAVKFRECRSYEQLASALAEVKPEIILGYKFEPRPFPRGEILSCEGLRWLSLASAGVDHVAPWDDTKLIVTSGAGVAAVEMGHYALAAILGMFHGFPQLFADQVVRRWNCRLNRSARNATVGLVGLGRSGKQIARMARAVGLKVVACRMRSEPCEYVDAIYPTSELYRMLGAVDVTVVCVALTPLTRDLFGHSAFAAMKPGSYFINMARGAIVQEEALIDALVTGQLAAAVIDVARTEPLPPSSPLWNAPNLLITPHSSGDYEGWARDAALMFADNLERWLTNSPLENRVLSDRGY